MDKALVVTGLHIKHQVVDALILVITEDLIVPPNVSKTVGSRLSICMHSEP